MSGESREQGPEEETGRQIALLKAIIMIFREATTVRPRRSGWRRPR